MGPLVDGPPRCAKRVDRCVVVENFGGPVIGPVVRRVDATGYSDIHDIDRHFIGESAENARIEGRPDGLCLIVPVALDALINPVFRAADVDTLPNLARAVPHRKKVSDIDRRC